MGRGGTSGYFKIGDSNLTILRQITCYLILVCGLLLSQTATSWDLILGVPVSSLSPKFSAVSSDGTAEWFDDSADLDQSPVLEIHGTYRDTPIHYRFDGIEAIHQGRVGKQFCFITCARVSASLLTGLEVAEQVQVDLQRHTLTFSPEIDGIGEDSRLFFGIQVVDASIQADGTGYTENASEMLPLPHIGYQKRLSQWGGANIIDAEYAGLWLDSAEIQWMQLTLSHERKISDRLTLGGGVSYTDLALSYERNMTADFKFNGLTPSIYLRWSIGSEG